MSDYTAPDAIDNVLQLMRDTFGCKMNAYYEGDPILIPKANLPCIIVEEPNSNVTIQGAPTEHDSFGEKLTIRIVYDKDDDVGADDAVDLTERKIRKLIQGRDKLTRQFSEGTLLWALRTHVSLGNSVIDNDVDISYGLQPRPEGQFTSEGTAEIVVRELVRVPDRM